MGSSSLKKVIKYSVWGILLILLLVSLSYITTFTALFWSLVQPANIDFENWDKPDPELVIVDMADHQFAIPQGYFMSGRMKREKVKVSDATLWALLPDMKPYAQNTKQEFEKLGYGKVVLIGVGAREDRPRLPEVYQRIKGRYSELVSNENMKRIGLELYREPGGHWDELMVHLDGGNVTYIMQCMLLGNRPSPSCKVHMDYSDEIYVRYTFGRDHLEQWQEIDAKVRKTLRHFEQSATTSSNNQ